jgi:hypothetical protein
MNLFAARHPVGLQAVSNAIDTAVMTFVILVSVVILVAGFLAERRTTGRPSFISRVAARWAGSTGTPLWERLPFRTSLVGLAAALVGWRISVGDGPLMSFGLDLAAIGLALSLLAGITAGALAHPPRSLEGHAAPDIADPAPAHRIITLRGRLGAGPIGAVLIGLGATVSLATHPLAAAWRFLQGTNPNSANPARDLILIAVGTICWGTWLLHGEGRAAGRSPSETNPGAGHHLDLGEMAGATSVVLWLSVVVDSGLMVAAAATAAVVVLIAVRLRTTAGGAALTVAAYIGVRLLAAVLAWSFGSDVAPMAWQALVAALAVEFIVAAVLTFTGTRRSAVRF